MDLISILNGVRPCEQRIRSQATALYWPLFHRIPWTDRMRRQSPNELGHDVDGHFRHQRIGLWFLAAAGIRHHSSADECSTSQQLR